MTDPPYPSAPRPPWWHQDLVAKVDANTEKLDELVAASQRNQGMRKLAIAVGSTIIVCSSILVPIITIVYHH